MKDATRNGWFCQNEQIKGKTPCKHYLAVIYKERPKSLLNGKEIHANLAEPLPEELEDLFESHYKQGTTKTKKQQDECTRDKGVTWKIRNTEKASPGQVQAFNEGKTPFFRRSRTFECEVAGCPAMGYIYYNVTSADTDKMNISTARELVFVESHSHSAKFDTDYMEHQQKMKEIREKAAESLQHMTPRQYANKQPSLDRKIREAEGKKLHLNDRQLAKLREKAKAHPMNQEELLRLQQTAEPDLTECGLRECSGVIDGQSGLFAAFTCSKTILNQWKAQGYSGADGGRPVLKIDGKWKVGTSKTSQLLAVHIQRQVDRRVFTIAVGHANYKGEAVYKYLLQPICNLLTQVLGEKEMEKMVICSDHESALVNAIHNVFPKAQQIICAFHVSRTMRHVAQKAFPVEKLGLRAQHYVEKAVAKWQVIKHKSFSQAEAFAMINAWEQSQLLEAEEEQQQLQKEAKAGVTYFCRRARKKLKYWEKFSKHGVGVELFKTEKSNSQAEAANARLKKSIDLNEKDIADLGDEIFKFLRSNVYDFEDSPIRYRANGRTQDKGAPPPQPQAKGRSLMSKKATLVEKTDYNRSLTKKKKKKRPSNKDDVSVDPASPARRTRARADAEDDANKGLEYEWLQHDEAVAANVVKILGKTWSDAKAADFNTMCVELTTGKVGWATFDDHDLRVKNASKATELSRQYKQFVDAKSFIPSWNHPSCPFNNDTEPPSNNNAQ